jgi:hypothetical protein
MQLFFDGISQNVEYLVANPPLTGAVMACIHFATGNTGWRKRLPDGLVPARADDKLNVVCEISCPLYDVRIPNSFMREIHAPLG